MRETTEALLTRYFEAFNAGDTDGMLALVADDLRHDVNQGETRLGKEAFTEFNAHMTACYKERLSDLVLMTDATGERASAEFIVHGEYLRTDEGLPEAKGQTYYLPAGTFFEVSQGKIQRITTYYNLSDWIVQVVGPDGDY
ncbi:MAG: ketosteroid isomerase-related protein [Nitrincola lacisaponensis]|uniref:ketosteroid isomerase-related protein n=1 Tax=Nitrincola lacisaponensis TaxID=267850 RepID=UPI003919AB28